MNFYTYSNTLRIVFLNKFGASSGSLCMSIVELVYIAVNLDNLDSMNDFRMWQSMFMISLLTGSRARILKVTRIWAGSKQKSSYNVEIGLVMRGSVACEFLYFLAVFMVCNLDKSMFSYKVDREGVLSFRLYNLTSMKMFEFSSELVGWGDSSLSISVFTSGMPDKVSAMCFWSSLKFCRL